MPFLHLRLNGVNRDPAGDQRLSAALTRLTADLLHKRADLTSVLIERLPPETGWFVGGQAARVAAHLEINVTDGTNSAGEKAAYVAATANLLRAECGPDLPVATYVIVRDCAAETWGYDGQTQAARRVSPAPAPRPPA